MEKSTYKVSATVAAKYAPIINRTRMLHLQTPKSEFPALRERGVTHIDIWLDGSIYPHQPDTNKRPKFRSVSDLLEFVGEGKKGLLGYIEGLSAHGDGRLKLCMDEAEKKIAGLQEHMRMLSESVQEKNRLLQFTRDELQARERLEDDNRQTLLASELLKNEINCLKSECRELEERLVAKVNHDEESRFEMDLDFWIEIESLRESYEEKLKRVKSKLKKSNATLRRRESRLQNLTKTPYGYRTTVRERKDLSSLAPRGGQAKRMLQLARSIIQPATLSQVQSINQQTGSRHHLCGDKKTQVATGKVLASLLSKAEATSLCESEKLSSIGIGITNKYLDKIGKKVGPNEICETMDCNGISQRAYAAVYKKFKLATRAAGCGLRVGCLPNPHQVSVARSLLNLKLKEYVGDYYSIVNSTEFTPSKTSKSKDPIKVSLNEFNSIFVDVERVQQTMVELCNITPTELGSQPLIFVLKLDEAEIVHSQKMERVSITLMNRALDKNLLPNTEKYFSVQSEREIWPIACFRIPRESHEILKWIFDQKKIPTLIKAQEERKLLNVPGIGSFPIEWHLAADMKTIKCVYGLGQGANAKFSCIYCNQERTKSVTGTVQDANILMNERSKHSWKEGLFSKSVSAKPLSGGATLSRWRPIFSIPLDRVHICTLHGLNRIVEKILHLHFIHIGTIRDEALRKAATKEMERIISKTGAHGGNVMIFKDEELSGKSNNVPNKPSLSGAHALKIFKEDPESTVVPPKKRYIDVVNAERNNLRRGQAKRDKIKMWRALDAVRPYFIGLRLTEGQSTEDFKEKVDAWGHLYLK